MGITNRPPAPPQIPYLVVSSSVIESEMDAMGLEPMYPCLLDDGQNYHYTTDKGWRSVAVASIGYVVHLALSAFGG